MSNFPLKPTHAPVKAYYAALAQFADGGHHTEGNTRSAFADLLKRCCSPYEWHLVEEFHFKGTGKQPLRADGALIDKFHVHDHAIHEAENGAHASLSPDMFPRIHLMVRLHTADNRS